MSSIEVPKWTKAGREDGEGRARLGAGCRTRVLRGKPEEPRSHAIVQHGFMRRNIS